MRQHVAALGVVIAVAILSGACGGDDGPANVAVTSPEVVDDGGSDDLDSGDEGASSFELHPSISNLPLPAGYQVLFPADEYSADQDERETVVQLVQLTQPHDEVARFLLAELPAAGFTIVEGFGGLIDESGIMPGVAAMLFFENPEGLPGQITINPLPDGTTLNINFYRAGDYSS